MINEDQVRETLGAVLVPGIKRSIADLNLIQDIIVSNHKIKAILASTALSDDAQEWLKAKAQELIENLSEINEVEIDYIQAKPAELNKINNIIAVMSGKGGVGKSLVAGLTAVALKRKGYEVGILDADITGPSIPKMFGISSRPAGSDTGILPVIARSGIILMSLNLLLSNEEEAVIWRGPLISNTIKQFGEEVIWGNLDYLVIDLPPGTADAPLTVMQSFNISGVIIVYTPQDLVDMIVKKAVNMAKKMGKPILGVVENMSYLYVPEIDKKIEIFGKGHGDEMAKTAQAPLLGQIPLDPDLARLCDTGNIERYSAQIIDHLGEMIPRAIPDKVI